MRRFGLIFSFDEMQISNWDSCTSLCSLFNDEARTKVKKILEFNGSRSHGIEISMSCDDCGLVVNSAYPV